MNGRTAGVEQLFRHDQVVGEVWQDDESFFYTRTRRRFECLFVVGK
jgi:hypothetical protein